MIDLLFPDPASGVTIMDNALTKAALATMTGGANITVDLFWVFGGESPSTSHLAGTADFDPGRVENYFGSPDEHYNPTYFASPVVADQQIACGYEVDYPRSWVLAYRTGKCVLELGKGG